MNNSSEINTEEKGEENIDNTEENVINSKNKTFNFSLVNISKYKKYTLNYDQSEKINDNNFKANQANVIIKNIVVESFGNEKIEEENILKKMNIYNNKESDKNVIKEENLKKLQINIFESKIPSEEIFIRQKEQIKIMKEKNDQFKYNNSLLKFEESLKNNKYTSYKKNLKKSIKNLNQRKNNFNMDNKNKLNQKNFPKIRERKSFKETGLFLTLDNPEFFEISYFLKNIDVSSKKNINEENDFDNVDESQIIPIINNNWENVSELKKKDNYIELSNIALRTLYEINYNTSGVEINIDFSLVGESELWIFSRCFVNKDFNDSEIFDVFSMNIESNDIFNKYTSLIKIIKEKNSSKCFASFGIFYEDESDGNKVKYETFLKRQLVDYSQYEDLNMNHENSIYYYLENDLLDIRMIIMDLGTETIDSKIFINNNQKYNHIEGKFYLPTIKRSKILLCGIGQSVQVRKLRINNIDKFGEIENDEINKKSCTCCYIF